MLSLKWELSACLKWWTNLTSPNLDIGPWTSNCWMSLSMELAPCRRVESFCHAIASRFGSVNMRSTIVIGIPEGLRTCWMLCVAHVPAAPPFMYDRMNSIWLISSGNLDPRRRMYRLHSTLKQLRSSCRPVNRVGAAIFRSLVVVGGGGGSTGGDGDQALSWFCSAWICCVSSATCSLSVTMVVGMGMRRVRGFEVFFCCQSMCKQMGSGGSLLHQETMSGAP